MRAALGEDADAVPGLQSLVHLGIHVLLVYPRQDLEVDAADPSWTRVHCAGGVAFHRLHGELQIAVDIHLAARRQLLEEGGARALHCGGLGLGCHGALALKREVLRTLHTDSTSHSGNGPNQRTSQRLASDEEPQDPREGRDEQHRIHKLVVVVGHEDHGTRDRHPHKANDVDLPEEDFDGIGQNPPYEAVASIAHCRSPRSTLAGLPGGPCGERAGATARVGRSRGAGQPRARPGTNG
mmetsp:Transcript_86538/g.222917  ORF Transcript_86538/g.222917 Transcript_86538/m.222917 type:complete len:239 (-) Transcript_86538:25-741(-)